MISFPLKIEDLPLPPPGRTGFPWTEGTRALPKTLAGDKAYPKISVVTPSYQQGEYLEETIRSVLLQGYPNLEYIVIDGGSQDNSVEIIQKYERFLTFWVSERDSGQANAINKGFAHTTGDVMGWLNSDDILLPGALYWIARTLIEKPQAQLVTGLRKNIDKESRFTSNFVRDIPTDYYVSHYCCIAQETTYWRRSVWEALGSLDEKFHFALDYEYWLRAIHNGYTLHLIPRYMGGFRDYSENKTNSWIDVYYRDMNTLYTRYAIGKDEADVHAKLGACWARRYGLYLKVSQQSWTNYPRLVQLAWRVLETPVLCKAILSAWRFRQIYREFHQNYRQSKRGALRSVLAQARYHLVELKMSVLRQTTSPWGDVRQVLDRSAISDAAVLSDVHADTLAFGENWYPTEFYHGEYFRWCSGTGEIIVVNASGEQTELRLIVSPGVVSSEHRLDLIDEKGTLLTRVQADQPKLEINAVLPAIKGTQVRYRLRWSGLTAGENQTDDRRLAFRILHVGWQNSGEALNYAIQSFQQTVDSMLTRRSVDTLPVIGALTTGIRRWRNANEVMNRELALWQWLAANSDFLDAEVSPTAPRFVIDCSTYMINNNGDRAMFTVLLRRLRARYPDAHISMITNDAEGIASLDANVTPIVVGNRRLWSVETILKEDAAGRNPVDLWKAENALRAMFPRHYWTLLAANNSTAAQVGWEWQTSIKNADAVFLTGGGYFTDAFAEHALSLLTTLEAGIAHGAAVFIVGCGFEPTTDAILNAAADSILPRVDFITCREDRVSPQVLVGHGVDPTRFNVTGDDALELAFEARPPALGNLIGVNLRNAIYNPVDETQIEIIRSALTSASEDLGTHLVPLPISNWEPWDSHEIKKLIAGGDGGASLNTPEKLFEQIRECRLIVTGSYHAAVFGLAMGIPVIALTNSSHYQHKMQGLLSAFTQSGIYEPSIISLDDPDLGQKLAAAIRRLWAGAHEARPYLLETAEQQIQAGHRAYENIFKQIDNRRRDESANRPQNAPTLAPETVGTMLWIVGKLVKSLTRTMSERNVVEPLPFEARGLQNELNARNRIVEELRTQIARMQSPVGQIPDEGDAP